MPRDYEPVRDPHVDNPPKRYKAPKALRTLWKLFPYESQMFAFRRMMSRDPRSDEELHEFAETYILEVYNSGADDPRLPGDPAAK